ncbi:M14 family metallopeptidase [Alteribacter aurantiacus]|uniref:M14 family metallopeptidase n=1 Tax=Alteribacter aurantiacus TaxID=254410 RepID=UPI000419CB83|nr:M14 family metallopeptidase [Alteribacter aurantiacus]
MNIRIRQGDSFWFLSQLFAVPLPLLTASNPGIDPNRLQIGQIVKIPGFYLSAYTIQPGDSFWTIGQRIGASTDMIQLVNPGINPFQLQVNQQIFIPIRVRSPIVQGARDYDFASMVADIQVLEEIYPFITVRTIGQSVMGKNLYEIQVGTGEKRVHMNGSFHAHEWITTPILMQTLDAYLLGLVNNEPLRGLALLPLFTSITLSIVPNVNPDGVDLLINGLPEEEPYRSDVLAINNNSTDFSDWKANIRGVDLNNQFPARWEEEAETKPQNPAPRDFPGYAPLTEPESIAMADLTKESDFDRVLAYHTQGKVIFWGYEGLEPEESEGIVNEFARVSGFEPIQYVESYAGYKDWFIQEFRRPGFTVELGLGVNPLPIDQFDEMYEENLGIFLASLYM